MTFKDLKEFVNSFENDFDEMNVVMRSYINETDDNWVILDIPIESCMIDKSSKEFCLMDDETTITITKILS